MPAGDGDIYMDKAREDGRLRTDEQILQDIDRERLREIHMWLGELMPAARLAVKMMNAKNNLLGRWIPGARRTD